VQHRVLGMKFNLLFVLFTFMAHRFLPKYDVRMQLLMFQIKMLRDRIDDQRIVPTPEERGRSPRFCWRLISVITWAYMEASGVFPLVTNHPFFNAFSVISL